MSVTDFEREPLDEGQGEAETEAAVPDADGGEEDDVGELELHPQSSEELEVRLEGVEAENERLQEQLLRSQAELVNYRRRVQKERAELTTVAQAELLAKLLPVIDDFERAAESEGESAEAYHEGMKLILRSAQALLETLGVERLEPAGEPFDPRYHEAIARHETDEVPDGEVIEVYQPGYRLGEKLVRPATVVVAFGGAAAAGGGEAPAEEPTLAETSESAGPDASDDDQGRAGSDNG